MTDLCPRIAGSVRALARSLAGHDRTEGDVVELPVHGDLRQPSRRSRSDSAVVPGGDPLRHWRRSVGPADIQRAEEILTLFGLDGLYDPEGLPVPGVAENVGPAGFGLERRDSG